MEKQKSWQFYLIVAVIALTLYNILPTVFYYTKPLSSSITESRAMDVAQGVIARVNKLQQETEEWVSSFAHLIGTKPTKIESLKENPALIQVSFSTKADADRFAKFLPRAGQMISFVPAQLSLYAGEAKEPNTVYVERQIGVLFNPTDSGSVFQYVAKQDEQGNYTKAFQEVVFDRATHLALSVVGENGPAKIANALVSNMTDPSLDDAAVQLSSEIVDFDLAFKKNQAIQKKYFEALLAQPNQSGEAFSSKLATRLESAKDRLGKAKTELDQEEKKLKGEGLTLSPSKEQTLSSLESQINRLTQAIIIVKRESASLKPGQKALDEKQIGEALVKGFQSINEKNPIQVLDLKGRNPYIDAILINWNDDRIVLKLTDELARIREQEISSEESAFEQDKIHQFLVREISRIGRASDETFLPYENSFAVQISALPGAKSFLKLNLDALAKKQADLIQEQLTQGFQAKNSDLKAANYKIRTYDEYLKEKPEEQRLGFVIFAPSMNGKNPGESFRPSSIYVIARGLEQILQKYQSTPNSPEAKEVIGDVQVLQKIMQEMNFIGYPASAYGYPKEFARDYIFELDDFYSTILKASRENFEVHGSKRFALLPFTDVEQRIIALNKIEDLEQEDLLKWVESYQAAQIDLDPTARFLVPAPTSNPYLSNFKISFAKYFRGDDRKILKWGLDLSGGKTVRIGLRDHNNQVVTNPDDIKQVVNELYTRINKMGVSERTIRIENNNIVLEFPGSQALSASDLVKASAMYFHIVNEKFSPANPALRNATNEFLQDVWNEAVVTNRKDIDSIKTIAWEHLGGDSLAGDKPRPMSEQARLLYENGLRLANPKETNTSNAFNDSLSSVAMLRGEEFSSWQGQSHPLLFVFNNFALEGSSLTNIQVGYDPTEGNNLSFGIKSSYEGEGSKRSGSPRDDFYAWTSTFAEDKIAGTQLESYTQGRGWRMAVILNGTVISEPALRAALRETASISGRFSTREINQLAADLKAGSLSFTPKILLEQNVSAELGQSEKTRGIIASVIAIILVVVAMVGYYHFAGVVASVAVLLNLFIMWGVLQNLDAALTLPAIAGIVLTIGMAVDANVLVFERVREEFAISGRIASAIQAGYRKAFSAIVDSNITTIIAALILIQFDSGPIKGFAVTLIVGIVSSMFTALFATRYFFAGWVQNPSHKSLSMAQLFKRTNFDFLKQAKLAISLSVIAIVIGCALLYTERKTIFGMDFTGGYSLAIEVEANPAKPNYREEAYSALLAQGASGRDIQIRELTKPTQLKIQLGMGIEEKGQPFYQLPERLEEGKYAFEYQKSPRLVWVIESLEKGGLKISDTQLSTLDTNWSIMSGQFSDAMRNNAIIALSLALLSVLIYITFRFEFKYAVAAVVGLAHDVVITLGVLALFHAMGFLVQIDLQVIGAIMTIIGYSLNDTIIVFDRIREDLRVLRKLSFSQVINHALNVTLSRTMMTSGTTILVLLALVTLGGQSIFAFSLVMTIGVVVGTLSSLFIAAPMLLYMHDREESAAEASAIASKRS